MVPTPFLLIAGCFVLAVVGAAMSSDGGARPTDSAKKWLDGVPDAGIDLDTPAPNGLSEATSLSAMNADGIGNASMMDADYPVGGYD